MRRIDWNAVGAVVTAFATILLVAVTAKATNRLNQMTEQGRRSEKIRLTRDLYDRFFSLTASRTHAWFWLADFKPRESVRCFEDLWRVRDQGSFMEFYRVVAFWHSLYTLYLAEETERGIAASLFYDEYTEWSKQLEWVIKNVSEGGHGFPAILEPFRDTKWLPKP